MIDLILFIFMLAIFAAGFYCGGKFGTAAAMYRAARAKVGTWLGAGKAVANMTDDELRGEIGACHATGANDAPYAAELARRERDARAAK